MTRRRPHIGVRLLVALLAIATLAPGISHAQQAKTLRRKKPPVETPAPPPAPVILNPQQKPLIELAEEIGALAFLSEICAPAPTNPWRMRMETLIDAEGEGSGARDMMTGAFNRGYAEYSTTYRQCTPSARAARRILTRDAARIAREIERRFGI